LNWLAERSEQKTNQRIKELQRRLTESEALPALTEFENIVLLGLAGIAMFIAITPALAALVYLTTLTEPTVQPTLRDLLKILLVACVVVINMLVGFGTSFGGDRFAGL
jgi:hypothetical protein